MLHFREHFTDYENENTAGGLYEYDYDIASRRVEWITVENHRTGKKGVVPSTHVVTLKDKIRSKV